MPRREERAEHETRTLDDQEHLDSPVPPSASEMLQFLAQETRLFHEHLKKVAKEYEKTSKVPDSLFGVKKVRALQKSSGKKASYGMGRKPTTFNLFIKKRISEIKKEEVGVNHAYTQVFRRVVDEWNALTADEKQRLGKTLKGDHGAGDGDGAGDGGGKRRK